MQELKNKDKKAVANFGKYIGLGFQMLITIAIFVFAGWYIDEKRGSDTPLFTALLGLLGVLFSLYQVIRSFRN